MLALVAEVSNRGVRLEGKADERVVHARDGSFGKLG